MKTLVTAFCYLGLSLSLAYTAAPISLHPDNPHYFLWRGKPTILITSGEHYGALLNLDFDFETYFKTLEEAKLNHTRLFSGAYAESSEAFNIRHNTLDPAPHRFITPWARSTDPGYADGGNKFDLNRWDERYFDRLQNLMHSASEHGIVVEFNLFCPMYEEAMWEMSPMNPRNNVNHIADIDRLDIYDLQKHGGLLPFQEALVTRVVNELQGFDNVYLEISNEPYTRDISKEWEHHMVDLIHLTQAGFEEKFLVSLNIANNTALVTDPHPGVSILNFHYATPPVAVEQNFHLQRVIGDNETGFRGTQDAPYRMEAWDFILAGGGLFNHLDYSYTVQHPDGTYEFPATQPGGGGPNLRRQFGILRDFIYSFDFIQMQPANQTIIGGVPAGKTMRGLGDNQGNYAFYLRPETITRYSVRWEGSLRVRQSQVTRFHTFSNDGVRLWVDDQLLIDNWTDHGETEDIAEVNLRSGRTYDIKMEYFYNGGQAVAKLWWSSNDREKGPIPTSNLKTPQGQRGLQGTYYQGKNFDKVWHQRTDSTINFAWDTSSPFDSTIDNSSNPLILDLPDGHYDAEWISPLTGEPLSRHAVSTANKPLEIPMPDVDADLALRIQRRK